MGLEMYYNFNNMTDEEKKAIDVIKSLGISIYNGKSQIIPGDTTKEISTAIYTTINLIEKQSKEIEELKKEKAKRQWVHIKENGEVEPLFYVSKDKIKAKIEEIEKRRLQDGECELVLHEFQREAKLEVLHTLLNEEE